MGSVLVARGGQSLVAFDTRSTWRRRCTRGRIRTCGRTINRRLRFQLRHPGKGRAGPGHTVGHHRVNARLSSTARESNPARRFGRPGPSRSDSGTRFQTEWSSAPDLHRHVTRLQLAAYLFRSSGANVERKRRRRESNARDCRRPRFSKPACYHSSTSPDVS